ncbi:type I DNA topoisomerase [Novipirellula artificiosorum]|uniref:DNA topoisomerase 1 n=1 Tax=Novipirellula artificiosorum TaxID=2528016 RepID=A0A5C6DF44_9BACT|nr:type I DNA topoisomerase [Novipirellula artificiosorum]TWU35863.1 DNA topoisomerase 1 [Novipirellula artificiosorum]
MANSTGRSLVIVESPAKARTISKYLGKGYQVEASIGHIRDLPGGAKEVPEKYKKEPWAYLGVNTENDFEPIYIVPADKKKQVNKLKEALKGADNLYLATDEDREGEAISWHLQEILKPKVPVHRLVFHEITKEAIQTAIESPRQIDAGLVDAQETRRILDRLYGYDVSQLLWKKVGRGLSAGRVQSVAVRLIVERERERIAFHDATYWDLEAAFETSDRESFTAMLTSVDGRRIPAGKDFDATNGKLKNADFLQLNESEATELAARLRTAEFNVTKVEVKPFSERPKAPFTTSTLQQEANRKLGFTARRAMQAAQKLYENGYITYMRTDSTTLSKEAIGAARDLVRSEYGDSFLHPTVRVYANKVKNAQEAHEAIRPAGTPFRVPQAVRGELDSDQFRLFELIWKRTVACQMADAKKQRISVTIEGDGAVFTASGTSILFEGFLRAYVEGSDDPEAELANKERLLPAMSQQDRLMASNIDPKSHTTQPPSRYSEAALTRTLEEKGIGRPSTFASIIDTIQKRDYVYKKGTALVPSWTAFSVIRLLETHFGPLVDYEFTAQMEDFLDTISRKEAERLEYLKRFYFGDDGAEANGEAIGLKPRLENKVEEIDPRTTAKFTLGTPTTGEHREEVFVRVGKYGPFIEQGERRGSIPDGLAPDEMNLVKALELLEQSAVEEEPLGIHPETQKPIYVKVGRFGPYIQLGENDDEEKRNQSLLKGMAVEDLTLETACKLLLLPRTLGTNPENGEPVQAFDGRYGPYVKCEKETRSLPAGVSPLEVTFDEAITLLKQPKTRGRAAPKEPLRTYEKPSPVTEQEVKILDGRYGPYVTDGETNASLRKGMEPNEMTFEAALDLLAERAAKGPTKKKKKATKKKATKKKAAKKKSAKKKTTKKKGTVKKK